MSDIDHRNIIAVKIKELRESQNLTQEQLAVLSGLHQSNIARIEGGKYNMKIDTLAKIAEALNCTLDLISK